MFHEIIIENFRGIQSLKLERLGHVNLFVGENNCGKTSVLESFFLLTGLSNPQLPVMINSLRGKQNVTNDSLKYLFSKMDFQKKPHFSATLDDNIVRDLEISLAKNIILKGKAHSGSDNASSYANSDVNRINLSFKIEKNHINIAKSSSGIKIQDDKIVFIPASPAYQETMGGILLPANNITGNLLSQVAELIKKNKKDELLGYVKLFDSTIINIEILPDGVYVGYQGFSELFPLDLIGEGFKKYLSVIASVASGLNQIVLIDELENGIHFSAYGKLLKGMIQLAQQNNVQLMITTHGKELVEELSRYLADASLPDDLVCVYTLARTSERGFQAYRYTKEGILGAIENNMEIRQ